MSCPECSSSKIFFRSINDKHGSIETCYSCGALFREGGVPVLFTDRETIEDIVKVMEFKHWGYNTAKLTEKLDYAEMYDRLLKTFKKLLED